MYTERNEVRMRIAIVTGASSGMGREFVLQIGAFYKNLDEIWVIARRKENLERVAEQSRLPLRIFDGDLLKKPVYKNFARHSVKKLLISVCLSTQPDSEDPVL